MASARNAAIRRRLAAVTAAARDKVRHREKMREYAKAAASIGAALAEAGIDAAGNDGFRYFAYAARELSRWPDTPELQQADAALIAQDPELAARESLASAAGRLAARFAGRPLPDPDGMSPLDWYAWSLAVRSEKQSGGR